MSDSDRFFDDEETPESQDKQVQDAEGLVERRVKERIADARDRVADHKSKLLVEFPVEQALATGSDAVAHTSRLQLWAGTVKQYLRAIEPLLRSDEIPQAEYYYRELPIVDDLVFPRDDTRFEDATTTVQTPDGTVEKEIPWGRFYQSDSAARTSQLVGAGFEPPEPKAVKLNGLKSIMETDKIVREWAVPLDPRTPSFRQSIAYPRRELPLQKEWLESAVAEADQFLHDSGLGLDLDSGRDFANYSE
ncbi:hypothetical protein ACFQGE_07465 [Halomicroarcula sp. GCM10025817]|uniref:hypothetical protein n=1 Tax=Haloarcula TaxID=2237 RepID=UPI0023E83ECE|nr:hypothetical protein [Halomicroarcula sp. SYNS111]